MNDLCETNRVEHYLTKIMKSPNQWVKINKLKRQVESRNNTKERQALMMQIESALSLMDVQFEKATSFKIRIVEPAKPKNIFLNFKTGIDFAAARGSSRSSMSVMRGNHVLYTEPI